MAAVMGVAGHRGRRMWQASGQSATLARAAGVLGRLLDHQALDEIDLMVLRAATKHLRQAIKVLSVLARSDARPDWDFRLEELQLLMLTVNHFIATAGSHQEALRQLGQLTNELLEITKGRRLATDQLLRHRDRLRALADIALRAS